MRIVWPDFGCGTGEEPGRGGRLRDGGKLLRRSGGGKPRNDYGLLCDGAGDIQLLQRRAGRGKPGTITGCYATGDITSSGRCVGGLVGQNYQSKVIRCYSAGKPTGRPVSGALRGCDQGGEF